jgi:hypothetical protein
MKSATRIGLILTAVSATSISAYADTSSSAPVSIPTLAEFENGTLQTAANGVVCVLNLVDRTHYETTYSCNGGPEKTLKLPGRLPVAVSAALDHFTRNNFRVLSCGYELQARGQVTCVLYNEQMAR